MKGRKFKHLRFLASSETGREFRIEASAKGNVANIRITGRIAEWGRNNAEDFRLTIERLIAKGATECKLYINSGGGDVFVANEISNILGLFNRVDGSGGALVASAGTYIASHCDTFELAANSRMMLHKPKAYLNNVTEDEGESRLKLLKSLTSEYRAIYAEQMGITEDAVEKLWIKGDVWYDAKEALKAGLCTSVRKKRAKIAADMVAEFRAESCPKEYLPKIDSQKEKKEMNINPITLGLSADATAEQISAKVIELQARAQKADSLEAKAKADAEAATKKAVNDLIDGAITDKKITADQRPTYVALAESNFDAAKTALDSMLPIEKLSAKIQTTKAKTITDRSGWSYADYMEKDPEALEEMRTADEEAFESLMEAHYTED